MDLIYYHNNCPDGWCSAYIAKKRYPEAALRPLDHGLTDEQINALIAEATGKDVIMIDYSLRTRENNDRLAAAAKSFLILDHHKTAQAVLEGATYAVFDMNRSGAGIAWDYLFGECKNAPYAPGFYEKRPWFVNYIEDRDLWRWALPNGREICAYLDSVPWTVQAFDDLHDVILGKVLEFGRGAVSHLDGYVARTITQARDGYLLGYKVKIVNASYSGCSEIGNVLAKQAQFSVSWFERADDVIQFSLRSEGEFDVSSIAKQYGGGGHRNAAGFQLPYQKGRILIDLILGRGEMF